jgi:Zn-dependent protease
MKVINLILPITLILIPLVFAITLHEVAHGWVALQYGDHTAKLMGRITLNPLKHIDLLGTIIVPIALFTVGGFVFGWAKPVPVNWLNLRKPKRDMAIVAAAGPAANLLMACGWALLWKINTLLPFNTVTHALLYMSKFGVTINIVLLVLNLLPIPPLDGSRVVGSLFSMRTCIALHRYEHYGFLVLVALIASGTLFHLINPVIQVVYTLIRSLFAL